MLYANTNKINWIILLACITSFIVSPSYNQEIVQAKSEEKTSTGMASWMVQTVSATGKTNPEKNLRWLTHSGKLEDWKTAWISKKYTDSNSWTMERWVEYKIDKLIEVGIIPEIAESLTTNCKALAQDPVRCIKIWAFIVVNESSWGKVCKKSNKFNCFGLQVKEDYKSYNDWVLHFIGKYNKFWYKQTNPNWFYSNSPDRKPPTRFCLSEVSSWLPYCKNWHRIAWSVFNKLNF